MNYKVTESYQDDDGNKATRSLIRNAIIDISFLVQKEAPSIINIQDTATDITPNDLISNKKNQVVDVQIGEGVAADVVGFELLNAFNDEVIIGSYQEANLDLRVNNAKDGRIAIIDEQNVRINLEASELERGQYYVRLIHSLGDDGQGGQLVTYSKASKDITRNIDGEEYIQGEKFLVGDVPSIKEIQAERIVDDAPYWVQVALDAEFSKDDIDEGYLRYSPDANVSGNAEDSIGFQIYDGTAYSAASYTLTFNKESTNNVLDINDFATIADIDGDSVAGVKITSIKSTGKLESYEKGEQRSRSGDDNDSARI